MKRSGTSLPAWACSLFPSLQVSASSLDGEPFCDQPLSLLRGVVQQQLFAFPLAFSPVAGGTWTGKGFCVFSPLLRYRLDFSSCTTPPLSSSGAQCLKADRCTDSMSTSVGIHLSGLCR